MGAETTDPRRPFEKSYSFRMTYAPYSFRSERVALRAEMILMFGGRGVYTTTRIRPKASVPIVTKRPSS